MQASWLLSLHANILHWMFMQCLMLIPLFEARRSIDRIIDQRTRYIHTYICVMLRINILWYNRFVFRQWSPLMWEKTEPIYMVLVSLIAGQLTKILVVTMHLLKFDNIISKTHIRLLEWIISCDNIVPIVTYIFEANAMYCKVTLFVKIFLNHARTCRRLALAWFLKIDHVWIVGMRVCVRTRGY